LQARKLDVSLAKALNVKECSSKYFIVKQWTGNSPEILFVGLDPDPVMKNAVPDSFLGVHYP
jgi:hypothetical protein